MRTSAITLESELTSAELSFLTDLLARSQFTQPHLEVGTAAGGTLWRMMDCYFPEQRPQFVVVDPMKYFPDQLPIVRRNLAEHHIDPDTVDFRTMSSADAFDQALRNGESYDFIFIDGAHKIRYVMDDLRWAQLLNPGGLLLMHDYCSKFPGVVKPVNRFTRRNPHYTQVGLVDTLLALKKTAPSKGAEVTQADRLYALMLSPFQQLAPSIKKRLKRQ